MKAIDAIRAALDMNEHDMRLFEDMRDAPMTQPTSRGGNHPLWLLGHLAVSEAMFHSVITGEPSQLERWEPLFAPGTAPSTDAAAYPPYDELLKAYRDQRIRTLALLESIGDAGLDQPPKAPPQGMPPGAEAYFSTIGHTFLLTASHHAYHCGQLSVARRAAGRKPFF